MSPITTHILDTTTGRPAAGVAVTLEFRAAAAQPWVVIGGGETDSGGRVRDLLPEGHVIETGTYRLRFDTSIRWPFFPIVSVEFRVTDAHQNYHIPLLLSPFGYSTYRGS